MVYRHRTGERGDPVPAAFPGLVDEAVWEAVNERLRDPRRKTAFGTDRRHLGSSLYVCGVCGKAVRSHGGTAHRRYRCPDGCVTRSAAAIDEYVTALIRARLARPDVAGLVAAPLGREAQDAGAEIRNLRRRIRQTQADYDNDLIDAVTLKRKTGKLQAELDQAQARHARQKRA